MVKNKFGTRLFMFITCLSTLVILSACIPGAEGSNESVSTTIPMNPLGELSSGTTSEVKGTATLSTLEEDKTNIKLTLSGLEPNSSHMGHIHVGDCSEVGPVALGLSPVEADANGNGTSLSTITTSKLPAEAYIAYHQRGPTDPAGVGSFISCGDIK